MIALTLTIVSPVVLANDNNDIRKTIVVKFAKKAYSANYYGRIDGYKYDSYKFYAIKNTEINDKVELDDNGIYILPASGEYEIRVLQPRSQARKDKKPQYWMSIDIK